MGYAAGRTPDLLPRQQPGSRNCPTLAWLLGDMGRSYIPVHSWGDALLVGSLQEGSDHLDCLCPPQSPHLRAPFPNHYLPFPQPFFQLETGQGPSGPPSPPLGMEGCQQVCERFAVGFTMHGCLEDVFRFVLESQNGCH